MHKLNKKLMLQDIHSDYFNFNCELTYVNLIPLSCTAYDYV